MAEYPNAPAIAEATAMMTLSTVPQMFFFMAFLYLLLETKIRISRNNMRLMVIR